ncbi:Chloramphenicol phosphotransferase-like protein [Xaviernesmea oryzae]|nr:Chloramphenicol phosphotransferase-like protein [Xaviernesmea oryzae]
MTRLDGLPVLFVGIYCPLPEILTRRAGAPQANGISYEIQQHNRPVPPPILAWQEAVHRPGVYDLTLDTSTLSAQACADRIQAMLEAGPPRPTAFERLAKKRREEAEKLARHPASGAPQPPQT